jgi:hypothetical protein
MKSFINKKKLRKKYAEIYMVEPNSFGHEWIDYVYKKTTLPLKAMPFFVILPLAAFFSAICYLVLGPISIVMVSLLQYSF